MEFLFILVQVNYFTSSPVQKTDSAIPAEMQH